MHWHCVFIHTTPSPPASFFLFGCIVQQGTAQATSASKRSFFTNILLQLRSEVTFEDPSGSECWNTLMAWQNPLPLGFSGSGWSPKHSVCFIVVVAANIIGMLLMFFIICLYWLYFASLKGHRLPLTVAQLLRGRGSDWSTLILHERFKGSPQVESVLSIAVARGEESRFRLQCSGRSVWIIPALIGFKIKIQLLSSNFSFVFAPRVWEFSEKFYKT